MHIRFRYKKLGGHVHVRVFVGRDEDHLAKSGDLVFREDKYDQEWGAFTELISPFADTDASFIEEKDGY